MWQIITLCAAAHENGQIVAEHVHVDELNFLSIPNEFGKKHDDSETKSSYQKKISTSISYSFAFYMMIIGA